MTHDGPKGGIDCFCVGEVFFNPVGCLCLKNGMAGEKSVGTGFSGPAGENRTREMTNTLAEKSASDVLKPMLEKYTRN